jgi:hypothetical protein
MAERDDKAMGEMAAVDRYVPQSWGDWLYRLITPPTPANPDPRIPMPEGNPAGTPMPDPWRQPMPHHVGRLIRDDQRIAQAQSIPPDPRMRGWR